MLPLSVLTLLAPPQLDKTFFRTEMTALAEVDLTLFTIGNLEYSSVMTNW